MTTTNLFFELAIVGVQATIWCGLLVASFVNFKELKPGFDLNDWELLATALYLTAAYTLGIIVDRFSDTVFYWDCLSPKKYLLQFDRIRTETNTAPPDDQIRVLFHEAKDSELLDFVRSRLRVLRGTTLNFLLITIAGVVFLCNREAGTLPIVAAGFAGALATLASAYAMGSTECTYDKRIRQIHLLIAAGERRCNC